MRGMLRMAAARVIQDSDSGDSFSYDSLDFFSDDSTDFFSGDSTDFFSGDSTDSFPYSADSSDSGSSMSVTSPPQPTHSVLQVLRSAAALVAAEEVTSQQVFEGGASSVVATGTAINLYLRAYGQIPMIRSEGPDNVNLNALAPPPNASQQPPRQADPRPVICAYCNCAFCFGDDEVPSLDRGPGHVYPAPPVPNPITLNLLTPPAVVWPLYRPVPRAPGATALPECRLLVCSSKQHFKLTMGMLHPGGAPPLEWPCTTCLRVLPIVVGTQGSNSPDLYANPPAPPLEPWRYAGAYWNYVEPGHEDMVELKLHDDPLKLSLGHP